jgi:8-amino-7-oxononanoate synthase
MGLFDRHAGLLDAYRDVRTTGYDPFQIRMERVLSPTKAIINGRETLLVGTNNYFGLTFDPSCMEAAIEAIRAEGTGTTGSRIANGSYSEHVMLEKEIAEFYGKKHCMVFTTGYQANLGVIATLGGEGDFLLIDADSHASIYDACKMTQAEVVRFKHNDPASLEARLRRLGDKPGNRIVVLEGIYSMLGDSAPLREFVDVCKKYGAYVLIDEAHSLGALGAVREGRRARRLPFHRRHLLQDAGRHRRLLRVRRSGLRHPARHRAFLHVHRLAAALDRGLGPPGAARGQGAARAAQAALGQRRHPL